MANQHSADNPFQIQKLYIKEASFEIPEGVQVFQQEWKPEMNIELQTASKALAEADTFDVVLIAKCQVTCADKTAFIAEVHQAGIFTLPKNLNEKDTKHALGAFCPSILYPYLREAMADIVMKGGFPQLSLAPINFDILLQEQSHNQAAPTAVN